jgi:hypothetical protein
MRTIGLALLLASLLPAGIARADVIHLKKGTWIRGRIIEEGDDSITVEVPFGRQPISRREIARIERESDYTYFLRQGQDLLEVGSFLAAADHFEKALKIQPDSEEARRGLASSWKGRGDLLLEKRRLTDAIQAYRRALEIDPENEGARDKRKHARQVMAEAERLDRRAAALSGEEKFAEAARALEQSIAFEPGRWSDAAPRLGDLFRKAGDRLYLEGDHAEAARSYDRALRARPDLIADLLETRLYAHLREVEALIEAEKLVEARRIVDASGPLPCGRRGPVRGEPRGRPGGLPPGPREGDRPGRGSDRPRRPRCEGPGGPGPPSRPGRDPAPLGGGRG